jgi:hypothetical protein
VIRQHQLLGVVDAIDRLGLDLCLGQRRQQHCRQNGDNGNHDQQFNQCEAAPTRNGLDSHSV